MARSILQLSAAIRQENEFRSSTHSITDAAHRSHKAAAYQPDTAKAQLDKTVLEAKAAKWQPLATAAQGLETEGRFMSNGNLTSSYTERMSSILGRLKPLFD